LFDDASAAVFPRIDSSTTQCVAVEIALYFARSVPDIRTVQELLRWWEGKGLGGLYVDVRLLMRLKTVVQIIPEQEAVKRTRGERVSNNTSDQQRQGYGLVGIRQRYLCFCPIT
jgi:hypothetical protein